MSLKFDYVEHYKIDAEEFDYFEERSGATKHDEDRVHQYILSKVNKNSLSVLDVGTGSAWVAKHFQHTPVKVVSLDISKKNVTIAKQKYPNNNHYPIVADSFKLPFADNSFDTVIASEIIEHVISPKKFIAELYRVVNKGGNLIVTTPYKEKLRYYLCIHCNKKTPVHAHIHSFDENKLVELSPKNNIVSWSVFGNKGLLFLRTYVILQYFPFWLWKFTDLVFNKIKNIPAHIIIEYTKK